MNKLEEYLSLEPKKRLKFALKNSELIELIDVAYEDEEVNKINLYIMPFDSIVLNSCLYKPIDGWSLVNIRTALDCENSFSFFYNKKLIRSCEIPAKEILSMIKNKKLIKIEPEETDRVTQKGEKIIAKFELIVSELEHNNEESIREYYNNKLGNITKESNE